jgi:hypothetical protein
MLMSPALIPQALASPPAFQPLSRQQPLALGLEVIPFCSII